MSLSVTTTTLTVCFNVAASCFPQALLTCCLCHPWPVSICLSVCTSAEQRLWKVWRGLVLPELSWRDSSSGAAPTLGSVGVCVILWVTLCGEKSEEKQKLPFVLFCQDLAVFSLAQLLGATLCELDLTSCVNVTDLSVCAIATYLQKLVVLRLGWCKEVTDWGLLGMVETTKCEPDDEAVGTRLFPIFSKRQFL